MNDNQKKLLENLDRIKISIIMQVNLQEYPGSREDAINKFNRAIESFKDQVYKNAELIIVADGDNKVHQLYNRSHVEDSNIKFIYFDRSNTPKMYEEVEHGTYYRGVAREIGRSVATGSLITYMDSDDYLMPNFTMTHMITYNADPTKDFWLNRAWIDNLNGETAEQSILEPYDLDILRFAMLGSSWKSVKLIPGSVVASPWLLAHKPEVSVKWRDVISNESSEDVDFVNRLLDNNKNFGTIEKPIYIRCHYRDLWDY
jgi:glycosyltransferase involved in cell wall biosynthesis